jgi:hypothetical protein
VDRRTFLAGTGAVLLAAPLVAKAQQTKVYRVGFLFHGSPPPPGEISSPLILTNLFLTNTLRELGYIEGRNIVIDRRNNYYRVLVRAEATLARCGGSRHPGGRRPPDVICQTRTPPSPEPPKSRCHSGERARRLEIANDRVEAAQAAAAPGLIVSAGCPR